MAIRLPEHHRLLLNALMDPASAVALSIPDWDLLLRLARQTGLLGFLTIALDRHELMAVIPVRAANQLRSGLREAQVSQQQARWELNRVHWAFDDSQISFIALKGMAYALAGLPAAEGRGLVDLDVLVARGNLDQAEARLLDKGWQFHEMSAYDEYYYRTWSHEIPPLVHRERHTEVDMHHGILPLTSKLKIDTNLLFADAVVGNDGKTKILEPIDMVLHCAINLFQNNELADDLRDLFDLHSALLTFSQTIPEFWSALIARGNQLGLGKPLFYGLYFSRLILQTPIPAGLENQLDQRPGVVARISMGLLVPAALFPLHPDAASGYARLARFFLYVRSHWIRMPPHILLVHLVCKSYGSITGD